MYFYGYRQYHAASCFLSINKNVLYCIMRPSTEGWLDRYCIGIPREIHTLPWMSEGSLTCNPCHHKGSIF